MRLRTPDEQRAYLDGFERCAECIKKYLSDEGKKMLECHLMAVRTVVETEEEKSDNPLESFLGCMKNIYLQNKDEVDKVAKEMMLDKNEKIDLYLCERCTCFYGAYKKCKAGILCNKDRKEYSDCEYWSN